MQVVYKYQVEMCDVFTLELPQGARVLTVQNQRGSGVFLWALVYPDAPKEERVFRLAGTGHPINETNALKYIGTFQQLGGALVFHLFEIIQPSL